MQKKIKPVVKKAKDTIGKIGATYSKGTSVSISPAIWHFDFQCGLSVDTKGNIGVQVGITGGVSTAGTKGYSILKYEGISNAESIEDLCRDGAQMGFAFGAPVGGVPIAAGIDVSYMAAPDLNKNYYGISRCIGIGSPGVEMHITWGQTRTIQSLSFNVFNEMENIYVKIMEW